MKTILHIFFLLLLTCASSFAQSLDERLVNQLHTKRDIGLDPAMIFLSSSTPAAAVIIPSGIFSTGLIRSSKSTIKKSMYVAEAIAINAGLTLALKYSIRDTRPYQDDPTLTPLLTSNTPSFPSAHTSTAFATATSMTLSFPKWYVAVPAYAWASSVGYSRVHTGAHYPSDVIVGALVGIGSAYLTQMLNQQLFSTYQKPRDY